MIKLLSTFAMGVLLSFSALASGDLGQTMHQMKTDFISAAQATTVDNMKTAITALSQDVNQAKTEYTGDNIADYNEGMDEMSAALADVQAQLDKGDLSAAKTALKKIDALRVEYHKKTR